MNTWCIRCQKYTESLVGSLIVRRLANKKVRITNYSCEKCHTFKESILEEIPVKGNEVEREKKE